MIDIDFFKAFNDTYGHLAGDDALAYVGVTLLKVSRSFDVVGRIGGDEFAVALPTSSLDDASTIARRLSAALMLSSRPSVSIGYASLDQSDPSADQLVRDADRSLYDVKQRGRGRAAPPAPSPAPRGRRNGPSFTSGVDLRLMRDQIRANDRAAAQALRILDAYQSTSTVGLGFVDRDFRFIRVNPMLAAIHGGSVSDQVGRTIKEIVPTLWPILEPMYRYVLTTGLPVVNREVSGRAPGDPTFRRTWLTNLYPVTIEGELIGVGVVVLDITKWRRLDDGHSPSP
jgi:diguanylate cyclase (GGDEF)-like protein